MWRGRLAWIISGVAVVLAACGTPATIERVDNPTPASFGTFGDNTYPIQFRKIVVNMDRGAHIGAMEGGLACLPAGNLTWRGGRLTLNPDEFDRTFRDEAAKIDLEIVGDPDALFQDPDTWRAEYLVGGEITDLRANICYPFSGFGNWTSSKGEASLKVDWQIYSRLDRKVIAKITTSGAAEVNDTQPAAGELVIMNAFAEATQGLFGHPEFRAIVTRENDSKMEEAVAATATRTKLSIASESSDPIDIEDVRQSVVTIYAGDGHGSGFAISNGYLLTNSHVVETAERVRIEGPRKQEAVAEVVAADRRRDVALLKTDATWLEPLPIRWERAAVGSEVFAVGSPYLSELRATVTKGIVSSYRVDRGYPLIQTDAAVNPGNSGGPILDEYGNVIGIASASLRAGGGETGINFGVPIDDALQALAVIPDLSANS